MLKIRNYIFTIVTLLANTCEGQKVNDKKLSSEDSLKKIIGISDSIKILQKGETENSVVFLDFNKNSKFHSEIARLRFDHLDTSYYNLKFHKQKQLTNNVIKYTIPNYLINKWVPLFKFEGNFCVYKECSFQLVFETTDSTLISYPMDGADPALIINFEHSEKIDRIITFGNDVYEFEQIDNRGVYKIKHGNNCLYYTSIKTINNFNIIVYNCSDLSDDVLNFEKIDCK